MLLKPWYKVVTPREDLREGKPLDASEFAVHLDQVRDKRAPKVYQEPEHFFARTFLTQTLTDVAAEVLRRLSGDTQASAVFNLTTQFGGGKTHALTLLYHLARHGAEARRWSGVPRLLEKAGVGDVPRAETAVFVGTEFDSIKGRGGVDGTPLRRTPWGEIAFQLGGDQGFQAVAQHDVEFVEPKGDVIRDFLPKDRPCLILMDEIINYVSTYRKKGYHNSLYNFVQSLSETVRGMKNAVLLVSLPASEIAYTDKDEADEQRFKYMLDRLGKAVVMSAESETSEIIRRRLFEWDERAITPDGRVLLSGDGVTTANDYADWVIDHRLQLPQWFSFDHGREVFGATYPFHPMVLSVFERKWQALPRFQRTRGVLRILALWVSKAYVEGFKGAHRDPLIGLGTAPMEDALFRAALFEQLGSGALEAAVTTDICGRPDSHAVRLDGEAVDAVKKGRLHRKVATAIFFESNGGQTRDEATIPEIRLAVGEPELDIGHVEGVLESLTEACYYMTQEQKGYRFSPTPNLNQIYADRRGSIKGEPIRERVREEIRAVFKQGPDLDRVYFPEKSSDIPNRPVLTVVVLAPESVMQDEAQTRAAIEQMTQECGNAGRTFKNALIWCAPEDVTVVDDEARKFLAWQAVGDEWQAVGDEAKKSRLDEGQRRQVAENIKKAGRDLKEAVWRTYKVLYLLGKDNVLRRVDLGLVHSSAADSLLGLVVSRLRQEDEITDHYSPGRLRKNWPPALTEWSTRAVRDAFYASPLFPRLLHPDAVKETISRGVSEGLIAYVGKTSTGDYEPFVFQQALSAMEVDISDEAFIITAEEAKKRFEPPRLTKLVITPTQIALKPGEECSFEVRGLDQHEREMSTTDVVWDATGGKISKTGAFRAGKIEGHFVVSASSGALSVAAQVAIGKGKQLPPPSGRRLTWIGEVPPQKWMNFYTKVLSRFATGGGLKTVVHVEITPLKGGVTDQQVEETRVALRELGLTDKVDTE